MDAAAADALIARLREAPPLFLVHVNADPDCVGAAVALHEAFGGVVGTPDSPSRGGAAVARLAGLTIDPWPHPDHFATVVAVDTSSRSQLGRLGALVATPCLVDHHQYGDLLATAPAAAWDPKRSSACEVALAVLDRAGHAPSQRAAQALLVGLCADSARFRHADAQGLETAARLVRIAGMSIGQAYAVVEADDEDTEGDEADRRNAILTAVTRAKLDRWKDGTLVLTSEVGAHDAAAAASLVRIGADLAVVGREGRDVARMSLRASPKLLARGLHLGELANAVARELAWSGGGHEAAAGLTGKPPLAAAQAKIMQRARERLERGA